MVSRRRRYSRFEAPYRSAGPHEERPAAATGTDHETAANQLAPHRITAAYISHCEDLTTHKTFPAESFDLSISLLPVSPTTTTTTTYDQQRPPILIESSESVANAASHGASLSCIAMDFLGEGSQLTPS